MGHIDPAVALKLCLLEKECPCPKEQRHNDRACDTSCPCKGTGRVPLLELLDGNGNSRLRVVCDTEGYDHSSCVGDCTGFLLSCNGRGWLPSTDPWVWLLVALNILSDDGYIVVSKHGVALVGFPGKPQQDDRVWAEGSPENALLVALEQASEVPHS